MIRLNPSITLGTLENAADLKYACPPFLTPTSTSFRASGSATELPQQVRSQVQLGNEGKGDRHGAKDGKTRAKFKAAACLSPFSCKGSLDTLRHWAQAIHACAKSPRKQAELINRMLEALAGDLVPKRPGRLEPRAKKRRPKSYQLLTQPRRQMKVIAHREKYRAPRPKTPLS